MYNITVTEISNFENSGQLEEAYHASHRLEVRAGILHGLLHESYDVEMFPTDWKNRFLLYVCKENIDEAARLRALDKTTPFPGAEVPHEKASLVIRQKRVWIARTTALAKMATHCIATPMNAYIDYRGHIYKGPETETDRNAEEVLKLISDWDSAPYLNLRTDPTGKAIPKFLQIYRRHHGSPPDAWFQGVIHSQNFHLLRCENLVAMGQKIEEQLGIHLKKSMHFDGHASSEVLTKENTRGIHSYPVADYLVEHLLMTGRLDPILAQV